MRICKSLSLITFFICLACSRPLPDLEGIDRDGWSSDRNGCTRARADMRPAIDREKEKLLALDQLQIVKLLGRPDENELSERNQKFFYYYLDPGPSCALAADTLPEKLAIRFNAMGLAKEVALVRGKW
jgi:hypothetical protein